jgi:hypothetical protein
LPSAAHEWLVNRDRRRRFLRCEPGRGLPEERAELALELPDARLARVVGDHRADDGVVDGDLVGQEPVPLDLTRPQVAARDRDLLLDRVAVEADDLHAVEQRTGDGVGDVRRRDEEDVREIDLDVEVVVAERVVLRGVEHLEECRGRVAAPVGPRPCRPRRSMMIGFMVPACRERSDEPPRQRAPM